MCVSLQHQNKFIPGNVCMCVCLSVQFIHSQSEMAHRKEWFKIGKPGRATVCYMGIVGYRRALSATPASSGLTILAPRWRSTLYNPFLRLMGHGGKFIWTDRAKLATTTSFPTHMYRLTPMLDVCRSRMSCIEQWPTSSCLLGGVAMVIGCSLF